MVKIIGVNKDGGFRKVEVGDLYMLWVRIYMDIVMFLCINWCVIRSIKVSF